MTDDLQTLKRDLENANREDDALFHELVFRSITILGLPTKDVAKALGMGTTIIEKWMKGDMHAHFSLRPWVYQYFLRQINLRNDTTTYHATDEYGYRYTFNDINASHLSKLLLKLAVCGRLLERVQVSYLPTKMYLSFFMDSTKAGDFTPIEELHHLIKTLGGEPEVRVDSGNTATVIPISKKEREHQQPLTQLTTNHCGAVEDGCFIFVEGKCSCVCCLLEPKEKA